MTAPQRQQAKDPLDHEPEAVAYARSQSGLTQQQLADLCGVSRSLITEIELGTRNARPPMIRKLATALNCPRVVLERKREPEATPSAARDLRQLRDGERAEPEEVPELRGGPVERTA